MILKQILLTMRPKQWPKNFIVYLALIFSINLYWHPTETTELVNRLSLTTLAVVLFCLISSAVYIINDLVDIEKDRTHPKKRNRPLASGKLKPAQAFMALTGILLLSIPIAFSLSLQFGIILSFYFVLNLAYSFVLKNLVIVDVFTVAAGFVLRAVAGAAVINVPISPWLYVCTILGALFLILNKRRNEMVLLDNDATNHRRVLQEYTPKLLDDMIAVVTPTTAMAYFLYTFSAPNLPKNNAMMLTIPFVLYGIFRYQYLVHLKNEGGSPEDVLFKDIPLIITIGLWLLVALGVLVIFRSE